MTKPIRLVVRAHAKVNLDLRILGVRPDGYHELRTVFQSLEFHDTLTCSGRPGPFALKSRSTAIPLDQTNLIWRAVAGAEREGITVQYTDFAGGRASTVFVRARVADLTLRLSQVEINVPLDPRIFDVEVPKNAEPLTLDELRRAGPLGEKGTVTVSVSGVENGDCPR